MMVVAPVVALVLTYGASAVAVVEHHNPDHRWGIDSDRRDRCCARKAIAGYNRRDSCDYKEERERWVWLVLVVM
jgi:hypothetical protein